MIAYKKTRPLVEATGVAMTICGHQILRDVNATISDIRRDDGIVEGQVVCILGPSGVGKTTLARILAGLDTPTAGTVLIDGKPIHRGMVGMVPQRYPLFKFATVRENFAIAGRQGGMDPRTAEAKCAEFVALFGLTQYLSRYPAELSGGTRQRVAIVRQLMCSDHFIVMDEPFSGLDPLMKQRACDLIQKVANLDDTNTIILSSHDVVSGMSIADTVWLMGMDAGQPGARIVDQYDLARMGLAWRPGIQTDPDFVALVAEVNARFEHLIPA